MTIEPNFNDLLRPKRAVAQKRQPDYQRRKCYAWENEIVEQPMAGEHETLESARALVDRILADYGLTWVPRSLWGSISIGANGPSFYAIGKELVVWKRGTAGGKWLRGGCCMARCTRADGTPAFQELRISCNRELILHETAHLLMDQLVGVRIRASHCSGFISTLIDLLDRYSDAWAGKGEELRRIAREFGLAVGPAAQPRAGSLVAAAKEPAKTNAPAKPKRPKQKLPRKPRAKSDRETSKAIVDRLATANPNAKFSEIIKLAIEAGVKRNTACGALVRYKRSLAEGA